MTRALARIAIAGLLSIALLPAAARAQVWQMWVHHNGTISRFNVSEIDSITFVLADTTFPAEPTISASPGPGNGAITVSWTAVGDDGTTGAATSQELRYATAPGTPWESMTPVVGVPPPSSAGTPESFTVTGLTENQNHCFRLRIFDDVGNSTTSDEACATTLFDASALVIAEVFGGAGAGSPIYNQDYIVLFNRGDSPIALDGYTIQFTATGSSAWHVGHFGTGLTVAAHGYFLIACGTVAGMGQPLPGQDFFVPGNVTTSNGKVALMASDDPIFVTCPTGPVVIDFVGYGTTDCFETAPAPIISNSTAAIRKIQGCQDTGDNSADFSAASPTPRGSFTPPFTCP